MAKDYYKILGVNKTDTTETIKKAYRDAVKRLHPDVTRGSFDKKRFYEIQEAYETLGDEEKRKMYDQSQRTQGQQGPIRGRRDPFRSSPLSDFFAWMEGGTPFRHPGGERRVHVEITLSADEAVTGGEMTLMVPVEETCPFCGGSGRVGLFPCPVCEGVGGGARHVPVRVAIPPMVEDGTVLNVVFAGPDGKRHRLVVYIAIDWLA